MFSKLKWKYFNIILHFLQFTPVGNIYILFNILYNIFYSISTINVIQITFLFYYHLVFSFQ